MPRRNAVGSASLIATREGRRTAPSPVRIWRSWIFVEIGFLLALIALFNLFPGLVGIDRTPDAAFTSMPLIAPRLSSSLPFFNIWWSLAITVNLFILFKDISPAKTQMARLAINLIGLGILTYLIVSGPIIEINPAWIASQAGDSTVAAEIEDEFLPLLAALMGAAISFAILVLILSSMAKIRRLVPRAVSRAATIQAMRAGLPD